MLKAQLELFLYPGDQHYFADSSLPSYDADATALGSEPAGYAEDSCGCDPGQRCPQQRSFGAFCRTAHAPPHGFAAVKSDTGLDGRMFYPARDRCAP